MCVCVQGSSTRKTLVCASSENSRESVRSLESALICANFIIVRNQSIFYTHCMYSKRKYGKLMEIYINIFSRIRNLKFLIARLQWIGTLVRTISGPNTYCCFFETFR